ncbi:hypothetical protein KGQ20_14580 [Catenulispora sp. NF23]|uniref:Uncharacterized protein n=1 Tax=Catenulispora pinistramenti TaxID=2705254 RepID=A0ABS5KU15_9ACTN|nr:hypothetical protein [Catenulispora pinistramenti]MBS2533998.1 hypothetical protein [Catenulispora pinistramenti]MBS2549547.1 hypothetical protein [Catenulispora pinistramenti]
MTIRIAGNTQIPALAAIRAKGYELEYAAFAEGGDVGNCAYEYNAIQGDRLFSATNPEELLGLIAMWETRGDDWKATAGDFAFADELIDNGLVYDDEGNVIDGE